MSQSGLTEGRELAQDFRFRLATDELASGLSSFEKEQTRDAVDTELAGEPGILIHIHLGHLRFADSLVRDFINHGRQLDARTTPRCPEVHEDRHRRVQHFVGEVRVSQVNDVLIGHL